jgi:hypothetical protein
MNNRIIEQLKALRIIVVYQFICSGFIESEIGKTLNEYRDYILNSLDDEEKSTMERLLRPLEFKERSVITPSIALTLIDQMLPLIKYQNDCDTLP